MADRNHSVLWMLAQGTAGALMAGHRSKALVSQGVAPPLAADHSLGTAWVSLLLIQVGFVTWSLIALPIALLGFVNIFGIQSVWDNPSLVRGVLMVVWSLGGLYLITKMWVRHLLWAYRDPRERVVYRFSTRSLVLLSAAWALCGWVPYVIPPIL